MVFLIISLGASTADVADPDAWAARARLNKPIDTTAASSMSAWYLTSADEAWKALALQLPVLRTPAYMLPPAGDACFAEYVTDPSGPLNAYQGNARPVLDRPPSGARLCKPSNMRWIGRWIGRVSVGW